jgi:hypothetical protein
MASAKTIRLLLTDGTLKGLLVVEDNSWLGRMLASPRESIEDLLKRPDVKHYGVYILLSEEQVYIGQASDLRKRMYQHSGTNGKDWWTRVVLLTTKDDSFNRSDIDYLEAKLINLADSNNTLHSDNRTVGNKTKVDEFRETELQQYLEGALLLLELIGIKVLTDKKAAKPLRAVSIPSRTQVPARTTSPGSVRDGRDYNVLLGNTYYMSGESRKTGTEYKAELEFQAKDRIVLKAGSVFSELSPSENDAVEWARSERMRRAADLNGNTVIRDMVFTSQNQAVRFVFGQSKNPWDCIVDANGNTIDSIAKGL